MLATEVVPPVMLVVTLFNSLVTEKVCGCGSIHAVLRPTRLSRELSGGLGAKPITYMRRAPTSLLTVQCQLRVFVDALCML